MSSLSFVISSELSICFQFIIFPLIYLTCDVVWFQKILVCYLLKDFLCIMELDTHFIVHHIVCIWATLLFCNSETYFPIVLLEVGSGFYNWYLISKSKGYKIAHIDYCIVMTFSNLYCFYALLQNTDVFWGYKLPIILLLVGRQLFVFLTS